MPDAPVYRLGLAKLLIQTGKKDMARTELKTLDKLGSKLNRRAEVSDLLKNLGSWAAQRGGVAARICRTCGICAHLWPV